MPRQRTGSLRRRVLPRGRLHHIHGRIPSVLQPDVDVGQVDVPPHHFKGRVPHNSL